MMKINKSNGDWTWRTTAVDALAGDANTTLQRASTTWTYKVGNYIVNILNRLGIHTDILTFYVKKKSWSKQCKISLNLWTILLKIIISIIETLFLLFGLALWILPKHIPNYLRSLSFHRLKCQIWILCFNPLFVSPFS